MAAPVALPIHFGLNFEEGMFTVCYGGLLPMREHRR